MIFIPRKQQFVILMQYLKFKGTNIFCERSKKQFKNADFFSFVYPNFTEIFSQTALLAAVSSRLRLMTFHHMQFIESLLFFWYSMLCRLSRLLRYVLSTGYIHGTTVFTILSKALIALLNVNVFFMAQLTCHGDVNSVEYAFKNILVLST